MSLAKSLSLARVYDAKKKYNPNVFPVEKRILNGLPPINPFITKVFCESTELSQTSRIFQRMTDRAGTSEICA